MNMSLRAAGLAVLSLFTLAACDESRVVGTLTTTSNLRIVSPGGNKQVLNRGTYRAAIRAQDKGAQVFITTSGKEVTFKIPNMTGNEQTVSISAAKLGQEFGLQGKIYGTQVPFDRTVEKSCVYSRERYLECDGDRHGGRRGGGRPGRGDNCEWVYRDVMGEQRVREIGYASYKNININLVNTASQKVGNFSGQYSYGDTITRTDYVTGCYRTGW